MVEFKGNRNVEELSRLLAGESPRCLAIVAAAFFDETLGSLLGDTDDRSFYDRINDALSHQLLTPNEHHDLHVLRELRNEFAHDLRMNSFDTARNSRVGSLRTWQYISQERPGYVGLYPNARERLLYVVGVVAFRLQRRTKGTTKGPPLAEPDYINDSDSWPPTISGPW